MIENLDILRELKTRGVDGSLAEMALNTLKSGWITEDDQKRPIFHVIDESGNKTIVNDLEALITGFIQRFPVVIPDSQDNFDYSKANLSEIRGHAQDMIYQAEEQEQQERAEQERIEREKNPPQPDTFDYSKASVHDLRERARIMLSGNT